MARGRSRDPSGPGPQTGSGGPDPTLDAAFRIRAGGPVAGIDEAGRGPWAGPVVAAAVILDPDAPPLGLDDSKALTEAARERLFPAILASADVAIAIAQVAEIDAVGIRRATLAAMVRAARALSGRPALALVDGVDVPPGLPCPGKALVKGDARSPSIAAASIVAKVTRDRLMTRLEGVYPGYGFARHKGYGTAAHSQALARLGVTAAHRTSFRPVRLLLAGQTAEDPAGTALPPDET